MPKCRIFPGPPLFGQHGPQRLILKERVRSGMELIKINALNPQRPEGILQLPPHLVGAENVIPLHETAEAMAEFRRHEPAGSIMPGQVFAHQTFRRVVPVTLGRVNKVDALGGGLIENGIRLRLREGATPFPAQLPGAHSDHRHPQPGITKNSITHWTQ